MKLTDLAYGASTPAGAVRSRTISVELVGDYAYARNYEKYVEGDGRWRTEYSRVDALALREGEGAARYKSPMMNPRVQNAAARRVRHSKEIITSS